MPYSEQVERWRPLVEKYFPANLVDKALYVINGESGGNPAAVGDGGRAHGLFQIQDNVAFSGRPTGDVLQDPEANIKYAAQTLGAAQGNWQPWGEGALYKGKPFGALGNHPYGGGEADPGLAVTTEMPPGIDTRVTPDTPPGGDAYQDWILKAGELYPRWNALTDKAIVAGVFGVDGVAGVPTQWIDGVGWATITATTEPAPEFAQGARQTPDGSWVYDVTAPGEVLMTADEYQEWVTLDGQVGNLEEDFETQFGPQALQDFITRQDYIWSSDPRNIDADNAATQFKNQFDIITEAAKIAADNFNSQADHFELAFESQAAGGERDPQGNATARNVGRGGPMVGSPARFVTFEAMFDQALGKLRSELPEVPDRPYYPSGAPPEIRSIGAARQEAIGTGSGGLPAIPSATTSQLSSGASRISASGRGLQRAEATMNAAPPAIPNQPQQGGGGGSFFGHGPSIPGFNIGLSSREPEPGPLPSQLPQISGAPGNAVTRSARDVRNLERIRGSLFR